MGDAPADAPGAPRRRGRPAVGRTTQLARAEIVRHALELVRREGADALTMRRLATELGVTPMAIYHHIPDKPALLLACVDEVWTEIATRSIDTYTSQTDLRPEGLREAIIQTTLLLRKVWLEHRDLAALAVAVSAAEEHLIDETLGMAQLLEAAGFPDVGLANNAIQNFLMGSIEIAVNRATSSRYVGRDPDAVLAAAKRMLDERGASAAHRDVLLGRFDEGDDRYFEAGLRALIAGLLKPAT